MRTRRALAGLWAILPLAALMVALTVLPPPDRVPTRWSGRLPDGFTSGPGFASGVLTAVVVVALVAAATAVLQRVVPAAWARWVLTVAAGVGWGAWLLYVVTVWRVGADGVENVRDWWALLVVAGAVLAAGAGYAVHGRRRPSQVELADLVPERARVHAVRGRGVREVQPWSTDLVSRTMQVIGWTTLGVFAAVVVLIAVTGESLVLGAVVVVVGSGVGGLALAWSAVRVRVDEDGLQVRSRVLPVRVAWVPAADVAGVDVRELDPMRWGGIGLRPLPEHTAYIVNSGGPGIVVYKRDGRRFALQVTEGDHAARTGARTLLRAAGQRLGASSSS